MAYARHPTDALEKGPRGRAGIAAVERRHEPLERAGEPPMIPRFLGPRRVIEPFHRARALQPQLTTRPLDRALVAHEPNPVLPGSRGPREEHGDQSAGIVEPQRRRVFHLVTSVAQAAGPRAHARRHAGDVEQLVDEMRPVVEQHAAPAGCARPPPRRPARHAPGVRRGAVDRELGQVPATDGAVREPFLDLHPYRIVAALMTRPPHAPPRPCGAAAPPPPPPPARPPPPPPP